MTVQLIDTGRRDPSGKIIFQDIGETGMIIHAGDAEAARAKLEASRPQPSYSSPSGYSGVAPPQTTTVGISAGVAEKLREGGVLQISKEDIQKVRAEGGHFIMSKPAEQPSRFKGMKPAYIELEKFAPDTEIKMQTTTQPVAARDVAFGRDKDGGIFMSYSIFPTPPTKPLRGAVYSGQADIEAGAHGISKTLKAEARFGVGVAGGMLFGRYAPPVVQKAAQVAGLGAGAYSVATRGVLQTALDVAAHPEVGGFMVGAGTVGRPSKPTMGNMEFVGRPVSPTRTTYAAKVRASSGGKRLDLDVMGKSVGVGEAKSFQGSIAKGVYKGLMSDRSVMLSRLAKHDVFRGEQLEGRFVSAGLQKQITPNIARTFSVVRSSKIGRWREAELPIGGVVSTVKKFGSGRGYDVYGMAGRSRGGEFKAIGKVFTKPLGDASGTKLARLSMMNLDISNVGKTITKNIFNNQKTKTSVISFSKNIIPSAGKTAKTKLSQAHMMKQIQILDNLKMNRAKATASALTTSSAQQRKQAQSLSSTTMQEILRGVELAMPQELGGTQARKQRQRATSSLKTASIFRQPTNYPAPSFPNIAMFWKPHGKQFFRGQKKSKRRAAPFKSQYTLSYLGMTSGLKIRKMPKIITGIGARFPIAPMMRRRRKKRGRR